MVEEIIYNEINPEEYKLEEMIVDGRLFLDANTLHRNEWLITGSEGRTEHDFLQAVRLISFGKINVKSLISSMTSLSRIEEGIKSSMTVENYRVLLDHEAQ